MKIAIPATFDPPTGAIGDKLAIIANYLQMRTSISPEFRSGFWIHVHSRKLESLLGTEYKPAIRQGESMKLMEINNHYSDGTRAAAFSKSYRLAERHRHGRAKLVELTTKPMRKRYSRSREIDPDNLGPAGVHLASKVSEFKLDPAAADDRANRRFWNQWAISRFLNGDYFAMRDRYGRLHTLLTQMPRAIRPFFSANGRPLKIVDVAACQPLTIGILADHTRRQVTNRPTARSPTPGITSPILSICSQFLAQQKERKPDIREWISLCESGEFYRYFHDSIRRQAEPAFATIIKDSGWTMPVDLRDASYPSFKRACLIPIMGSLPAMLSNPVFKVVTRDFPTVAQYLIGTKQNEYQNTARILQGFESQRMIDDIGQHLHTNYNGTAASTIHDALVVEAGFESQASALIRQAFEPFGVVPGIKIE